MSSFYMPVKAQKFAACDHKMYYHEIQFLRLYRGTRAYDLRCDCGYKKNKRAECYSQLSGLMTPA